MNDENKTALLSKLRAEGVQAGDEPTPEMYAAAQRVEMQYGDEPFVLNTSQIRAVWKAMQSAALASAPVPPAEVMDALNWLDDFIAQLFNKPKGSCESVNILRRALESAPVAESTLPLEKALHELVSKIAPGLDTGDLVQDAVRASALLSVIMASAPVSKPWPVEEQPDGTITNVDPADLASAPVAGEAITDDMRDAVRFAPSSAYWSRRLVEFFGENAREGINALEKQLRVALESAAAAGEATVYLEAGHLREVLAGNDMPVSASAEPGRGMVPLYAAPQASEAVRNAEDAERWRWATACDGNADKLCSIVLCHGGYQQKIDERADFYRAALSPTQPTEKGERDD